MQVAVDSFAAAFDENSRGVSPQDRLRQPIEEIEQADQAGPDAFVIGEHHRAEFLDSAPVVIPAAAAARTRRIRLNSAATVLSAANPVRVFQPFATLDLLSNALQNPLPAWLGVGGTPQSFARAGAPGLPLMVAIIGGDSRRFRPLVDSYREAGTRAGHPADQLIAGDDARCFRGPARPQIELIGSRVAPALREEMSQSCAVK